MTINAHFDGKVIVPDQPVDLPVNQPLILEVQSASIARSVVTESAIAWIAANAVQKDDLPADLSSAHDLYLYSTQKG